jgi:hypothetical protein
MKVLDLLQISSCTAFIGANNVYSAQVTVDQVVARAASAICSNSERFYLN